MNNDDGCHFSPTAAAVGVIMGSKNDWETMRTACDVLEELGIEYEKNVVSAHRTPRRMIAYANGAESRGLKVIIAGAGGAAHLPGMIASETPLPVIGVPIKSRTLNGLDSLLSIVQMPAGIPVATMAIGESGARNAGIFAARILSLTDGELAASVKAFIDKQTAEVLANTELE